MLLRELLKEIGRECPSGGAEIASVTDVVENVRPGSLFVAVAGDRNDGHLLVRQALERGKTTYTNIKTTIPVVANDLGSAGYNTSVNEERNKGAFVMGSDAMDINTLLTRSQTLAKSNGKGGGKGC